MKINVSRDENGVLLEVDCEGKTYDSDESLMEDFTQAAWVKLVEVCDENAELKAWHDAKNDPPKESGTYIAGWFCGGKGAVAANYWTGSSWLGCDNEPVDVWRHMPELYTGGCG